MSHEVFADELEAAANRIREGNTETRGAVVGSLIETLSELDGVFCKPQTVRSDGEGRLTRALEHTDAEVVFRVADLEDFPEESDAKTTLKPYITAGELATLLEWRASRLRSEPLSDRELAIDLIHLLASEPGAVHADRIGSRGTVWLGPEFGDLIVVAAGIGTEDISA